MFTGQRGARGTPEQRELYSWSQGGGAVQGLRRPKEATMTMARIHKVLV